MYIMIDSSNIVSDVFINTDKYTQQIVKSFPDRTFKIECEAEKGDKYINGEIIKPNQFHITIDEENHITHFYKGFDEPNDDQITISEEEYNQYHDTNRIYKYEDEKIVEIIEEVQEEINQEEINFDFDYRLCCLELGI